MSFDDGEIKLRLRNVNFNMLRRPDARDGSRSNGRGDDRRGRFARKRENGLRFGGNFFATARAINFQAAGDFATPFRLAGRSRGNRRRWLRKSEMGFAKRAHFNVLIGNRATLRADLNHSVRFALRTEDWRTAAS